MTDANCYMGSHFVRLLITPSVAKLCAAAGGPLVFIPDQGGEIYLCVLNERNGTRLPQ